MGWVTLLASHQSGGAPGIQAIGGVEAGVTIGRVQEEQVPIGARGDGGLAGIDEAGDGGRVGGDVDGAGFEGGVGGYGPARLT